VTEVAAIRSFCSEHTVEYVLVPRIVREFAPHYDKVVALYFWATREGNTTSRLCDPHETVRLVSVFPRRPKVATPNDQSVLVKFNAELFTWATESYRFGIPTFAGVPLVSSLAHLTLESPLAWFHLAPAHLGDVELTITLDGRVVQVPSQSDSVEGPINLTDVLNRVGRLSRPCSWEEALEHLNQVRSNARPARYFYFIGGYKPFHLLLFGQYAC